MVYSIKKYPHRHRNHRYHFRYHSTVPNLKFESRGIFRWPFWGTPKMKAEKLFAQTNT